MPLSALLRPQDISPQMQRREPGTWTLYSATYSQTELFPLSVQMLYLLLQHHRIFCKETVSQVCLHITEFFHVLIPVCQRLLQSLHLKTQGTQSFTLSSWFFPNLLVNPPIGLWGKGNQREEGNLQRRSQKGKAEKVSARSRLLSCCCLFFFCMGEAGKCLAENMDFSSAVLEGVLQCTSFWVWAWACWSAVHFLLASERSLLWIS